MSGAHTPGPWHVGRRASSSVQDSRSYGVAACGGGNVIPLEECQANARLVAAAPLMLEALEARQAFVDHENSSRDIPRRGELPEIARAAVWREYDIKRVQLGQRAVTLRIAALAAARGESPTRNEET